MKPTRYAGHFLAVFVLCMMHHALPASAGSILVGGDGEDAELAKQWGAGQNRADPHSGSAALELAPGSSVLCPEFVEVDPAKSYTIRGFFKTAQPHGKNRLLISIYFYDNAKQRMMPWCVWPVPGTETRLAADVKRATLPSQAVPRQWTLRPPYLYAMAFNAQVDLSDLPNPTCCLLDRPVDRDYAAGTMIRLHRYTDPPSVGGVVVPIWTEYSITVAGAAPVESPHRKPNGVPQFWYGTKYLKVMIRNRDREGGTLLCDDLKIEMRQVP